MLVNILHSQHVPPVGHPPNKSQRELCDIVRGNSHVKAIEVYAVAPRKAFHFSFADANRVVPNLTTFCLLGGSLACQFQLK